MHTVTVHPNHIRPEVLDSVRMVGRTVTWRDQQFKVYSVEGPDFYAFGSKIIGDPSITIDLGMARSYREGTYYYLLPVGCPIGEGYGQEVPAEWVKPGVCLTKQGDSVWH